MKKLIIFEDGTQAVLDGLLISGTHPVTAEIDLDELPEDERKELVKNRRKIKIERDEEGKVTTIRLGRKNLKIPRNG